MLTRFMTVALFAAVAAGSVNGQRASFTLFGNGCSRVHVGFGALSRPILGKSMRISADAPWKAQGRTFLMTGFSNRRYGNLRLPWDTSVLSTPTALWCGPLLVSVDVFVVMRFSLQGGVEAILQIPNDTRLLGLRTYHQALLWNWALGFGRHRFSWSRGGIAVIGRT